MQWAAAALTSVAIALLLDTAAARHHHRSGNGHKPTGDISLWIDQQQIKMFSGESSYAYRCYRCAVFLFPYFVPFFSLLVVALILDEENAYSVSFGKVSTLSRISLSR